MTYEEIREEEDIGEQKYINYTLIGEQGEVRVSIQNNESDPHFPVLKINDEVIEYKTHYGEGREDSIKRSQELIFEIVKYRAVRTVPYDFGGEKCSDYVPTLNVLVFANAFIGEKFDFKEIIKDSDKITGDYINIFKDNKKSVFIMGLGHASALFVSEKGKVYSFDTYGTHQNTKFNIDTEQYDYKGGGNAQIFTLGGSDKIANSVIAIEPDNRLQGDTAACAIWTICALLEVSKYDNIEDALLKPESINEKELTCKFKLHVLNNIIKLVSCIECGTYEEFDKFIKLEQGVDIDYIIPEKSKLISDKTKRFVGKCDGWHRLRESMSPIMSQSTIEDIPIRSRSAPIFEAHNELSGILPARSSSIPPPQKPKSSMDCSFE